MRLGAVRTKRIKKLAIVVFAVVIGEVFVYVVYHLPSAPVIYHRLHCSPDTAGHPAMRRSCYGPASRLLGAAGDGSFQVRSISCGLFTYRRQSVFTTSWGIRGNCESPRVDEQGSKAKRGGVILGSPPLIFGCSPSPPDRGMESATRVGDLVRFIGVQNSYWCRFCQLVLRK